MEADVSVTPDLDELLLGCDWLTKQASNWNFKEGVIQIGELDIRLRPKYVEFESRRVAVVVACTVPPRHEMNVPVRLEGEKVHQTSIQWAVESQALDDGVYVARTLFGNEDNVRVARILNHTGLPLSSVPGTSSG